MSLLELLQKTRIELAEKSNMVIQEKKEIETETNVVNDNDTVEIENNQIIEEKFINVAANIIIKSKIALRESKKLKANNSVKRLAKHIVSGKVTTQQLNKCFEIQRRFKPAHINYRLVGGDALHELKTLLDNGKSLPEALTTKSER